MQVQALHQDPVMVGRQEIKKEGDGNLTAGLWKQSACEGGRTDESQVVSKSLSTVKMLTPC